MAWFRKKRKDAEDKDESPEALQAETAEDQPGDQEAGPEAEEPAPPEPEAMAEAEPEPEPGPEPEAGDEAGQAEPGPGAGEEPGQKGIFARMASRLKKTRGKIAGSIDQITLGRKIDEELLDELEEVLVTADMGVATTLRLIEGLRGQVRRSELKDAEALKAALRRGIEAILGETPDPPARDNHPHVIMVVGVNGVGKTTTIGKLAHQFAAQGRTPLLAAADTFRAAAAEQLTVWAERVGCDIVAQKPGADPSAVAYDALEAAQARGRDLVIIDTAGRLHTKVNLMEELKKVQRVASGRLEGAPHEVLLVLDATTGQNAVQQAKLFHQAVPLTGLVLTKLDGTAKGGVVVGIAGEMGLPICFVGLGEGIEDLRPFDAAEFAAAVV